MSRRSPAWSLADLPDQRGRLAIVTGANSRLGFETAKELARAGAEVILATRSAVRGQDAVEAIRASVPGAIVRREPLNLASLHSVERFVDDRRSEGRPIDLLVNNAGVMLVPQRTYTVDGFELHFQTNFLGHYALTGGLLDLLRRAPAPRVVSLSSVAARTGRIALDDLQSEQRYISWLVYSQSKLAMLMLAVELDRRSRAGRWGIVSTAAHPGFARTNLQRTGPRLGRGQGFSWSHAAGFLPGLSHDAAAGALATLRAATDPSALGGEYFGPHKRFGAVGPPELLPVSRRGRDQATIDALWARSAELTGVRWAPELSLLVA